MVTFFADEIYGFIASFVIIDHKFQFCKCRLVEVNIDESRTIAKTVIALNTR